MALLASAETATAVDLRLSVLGSGSSGNCSLIQHGATRLLIDAGFSARETERRLGLLGCAAEELTALLITHEHADHVRCAHTLSRRYRLPIFCTEGTYQAALRDLDFFDWVQVHPGRSFAFGSLAVHPITVPHDAADPIGFRLESEQGRIGHVTDLGYMSGLVRESLKGCDLLLVEANHDLHMLRDGPYPWPLKQRVGGRLGHLSNHALLEALPEIVGRQTSHLVLAHLSQENNHPLLLANQVRLTLKAMGLAELSFSIASQDEPLHTLVIA